MGEVGVISTANLLKNREMDLRSQKSEIADLGTQMATGKIHRKYSDQSDTLKATQALQRQSVELKQIAENITTAKLSLQTQERSMERLYEVAEELYQKLVLLNNPGTVNDPSLALYAQNKLTEINGLLNQTDPSGQNPYAGKKLGNAVDMTLLSAPVYPNSVADTSYFIGATGGKKIQISLSGKEIDIKSHIDGTATERVIRAFNIMANLSVNDPDEAGKIREAQNLIREGMGVKLSADGKSLLGELTHVRAALDQITNAETQNQLESTDIKTTLAVSENTDMADAILKKAHAEVSYQTSLMATMQFINMLKQTTELFSRI